MVERKGVKSYMLFLLIVIVFAFIVYTLVQYPNIMKTITGKATTGYTNVSVNLVGLNPAIIRVWNESLTGATVDPVEYSEATLGATELAFIVTVSDLDGVSDLDDASVLAGANTSNARRTNTTACAKIAGDANTTSQNYTCTIRMFYFDNNQTWTISVNATDLGNLSIISNQSRVFDYGFLKAFILNPSYITWPTVSAGDTNKTSRQNTTLNNTGNVPINSLNIKVNAIDMQGLTTTTKYLNVSNFSSSWDSSVGMCGNLTNGILLVNNTDIGLPIANLTRGNVSAANATELGQEKLYYCIQRIPAIKSQIYATNQSGSWTIKIA